MPIVNTTKYEKDIRDIQAEQARQLKRIADALEIISRKHISDRAVGDVDPTVLDGKDVM